MSERLRYGRKRCPADRKRELLEEQGYACIYCAEPFGSVIRKRGRLQLSVLNFDHIVPVSLVARNTNDNWAASCNFCNQLNSSDVFDSLADAREYILDRRDHRGDEVAWRAPVSSEEDPERWAVKFATYLAGLPVRLAGTIPWVNPKAKRPNRKKEVAQ